jgi:cupin 2 domain-containing protein
MLPTTNLLTTIPAHSNTEISDDLVVGQGVRIERIVSYGQASPAGFWYDQDMAEWVIVLSGRARLTIAEEAEDRELGPGDAVFLPAHCRHRVAWTDPTTPTVWLAVFVGPDLNPAPTGTVLRSASGQDAPEA